MFGFHRAADGTVTFFTRGADRTTGFAETFAQTDAFGGAFTLWQSFQKKLAAYVNDHGGEAVVGRPLAERYNWASVRATYSDQPSTTHTTLPFLIPVNERRGWRRLLPRFTPRSGSSTDQTLGLRELQRQQAEQLTQEVNERARSLAQQTARMGEQSRLQQTLQQAMAREASAHMTAAGAAAQQAAALRIAGEEAGRQASVLQQSAQRAAQQQTAAQMAERVAVSQQAAAQMATAQALAAQALTRQAATQQAWEQVAAQQAASQRAAEQAIARGRFNQMIMGPPVQVPNSPQ
jgi:hypothetical protein